EDFSLAVAAGAAYYGRVRRGQGVKVKGGIAHAYYLETVDAKGETAYICVMPRDTDESIDQVIDTQFKLKTNQQVVFRLFSSATRLNDKLGELISDDEELNSVAPMISALKYGKTDIREIDAGISSRLTEVGSLQIFLNSKESEHQWPLAFDLRPIQDSNQELGVIVDEEKQISALNYIEYVFKGDHERTLKTINAALETIIGLKREKWSISLLRRIVDKLLEIEDLRMKSEDHESRWLNLLGYCLRPGFGDPGDELRMRHVWKLWFNGTVFDKKQCICEWWVFIRRVSPGLTEGQQGTIANALMKIIMPKNIYRTDIKEGSQAQMEMWHCLGSLELISKRQKTKILNLLMERGNKIEAWELWVVARLATRRLFRGPANLVVKVDDAWSCVEKLRKLKFKDERKQSMLNFAISRIAAKSGDRALDIDDKQLATVKKFLEGNNAAVSWIRELDSTGERDAKSLAKMLADTLPVGLSLG
ncbi:MAG: hypothetical protein MJH11_21070, partial [Lentisphaeria bacterium]|nr:hypothetical protein [Lentisphaeria bacterium]